jgi:hypothetical protein
MCQNNKCVDRDIPRLLSIVDFELTPPKDSGASVTQLANVDLTEFENEITIDLDPLVTFSGFIYPHISIDSIGGSLVAVRMAEFDKRRLSWNISVNDSGSFSTELSPGLYDITFKPADRSVFPQIMLSGLPINYTQNGISFELSYPFIPGFDQFDNQSPLRIICGKILESESHPHPVTGIKVEGTTASGLRTSIGYPNDKGEFLLLLPIKYTISDDGDKNEHIFDSINITIRPISEDIRLPTVNYPDMVIDDHDLGTLYFGSTPQSYSLSGIVVDGQGTAIPECRIRFETSFNEHASLIHQVMTDTTGRFATTLPASSYSMTVIPNIVSMSQMAVETVELNDNLKDLTVILEERNSISGTVVDHLGNPVPDVVIRAERISALGGNNDYISRTFEGTTGDKGTFELLIDNGRYNVTFIPPPASGLPRSLPQRIYVTENSVLSPLATTLSPPAKVQGRVLNQQKEPVCQVTIDIYHSDEDNAYLVGQTISGVTNREDLSCSFTAIIPGDLLSADDSETSKN